MGGISSDVIRGYNDTLILYLLLDRPSYGYEISKMIRAMSDEKYVIKETTLYSAFTRMEKNGFIESFSKMADNGKRRTYYRITQAGRDYYREKCEEWLLTQEVISKFISPQGTRALRDRGTTGNGTTSHGTTGHGTTEGTASELRSGPSGPA